MSKISDQYNQLRQQNKATSTFFPMLCSKPAIKDVSVPKLVGQTRSKKSFTNVDPLSPRISCTGQVKRHTRISAPFPAPTKSNDFSGQTHAACGAATSTAACGRRKIRPQVVMSRSESEKISCRGPPITSVADLDPPLPVIKKASNINKDSDQSERCSLWNRRIRSGGATLKSLQLQQINLLHRPDQPPTTV